MSLFSTCEKEELVNSGETSEALDCFFNDCITSKNSFIVSTTISGKNLSHNERIKFDLRKTWSAPYIETIKRNFGYPAWSLVSGVTNLNGKYDKMFLPFFDKDSHRIEALLIHTTNNENGETFIKFIPRAFVKNYPLKEHVKINRDGNLLNLSREYAVSAFTGLEQEAFDHIGHDLYQTIPSLREGELDLRDCIVFTRYATTECWAIYVGGVFRNIECSTTYTTETTGCDGAHTNGALNTTGGLSILGGGTGGTYTTPTGGKKTPDSNRCEEDGVGCEDDDEVIDILELLVQRLLAGQGSRNDVDPSLFPCIHGLVDRGLNQNIQDVIDVLNEHLGTEANFAVNVATRDLGETQNGETSVSSSSTQAGGGVSYVANITINSRLEGCTQDRIYATLFHEMIHAQLGILWSFANNTDYSGFTRSDFFQIYPAWTQTMFGDINQHNIMSIPQVNGFIDDMVINLRAFNPALSNDHARQMILSGFEGTNYWVNVMTEDQRLEALATIRSSRCEDGTSLNGYNFKTCPD